MMLSLGLQIFFLLVSTLALGVPTEVPHKCSTSSPNYCVCRENDTVVLKPATLCLSPTDQNDRLITCFPCHVPDQDLLNCTSLKDGYPVCPLQQFQSGESRSQKDQEDSKSIRSVSMSITKPTQETVQDIRYNDTLNKAQSNRSDTTLAANYSINRDDFYRRLTTEFKSEYVEQDISSVNKNIQQYLEFDKNLNLPTKPSKKLIEFIESNTAAVEQLGEMWSKILRLYQYTDMFEYDNAEDMNEIESNSGNNTLLLNATEIKSETAGNGENNETFGRQSSEIFNLVIYEINNGTKEDNASGTEVKSSMPDFNRYKIHILNNKIPKYRFEDGKIQGKSNLANESYPRKEIGSVKGSENILVEKPVVIPAENKTNFTNIGARYKGSASASAYNVTSTTPNIQAEVVIESSNFGNSEKFAEAYPHIKTTTRKSPLDQVDAMSNTGKYLTRKLWNGNLGFKAGRADLEAQSILETVTMKNLSSEKDLNTKENVTSNASMTPQTFQYDAASSNHSENLPELIPVTAVELGSRKMKEMDSNDNINLEKFIDGKLSYKSDANHSIVTEERVKRKVSENSTKGDSSLIENFELPTPMDVSKVNIDSSLKIHNLTQSRAKSTGKKHSHSSYKKLKPSNKKFKSKKSYRSTSLPYESDYVSKPSDENIKDLSQPEDVNLKNETISKIGRSLLLNGTKVDKAIARIIINESEVRSRSKRSTYPHNDWCYIPQIRRNALLECTLWTYKKECVVTCHKGHEIDGKSSMKTNCDRRDSKWGPKSISETCKESEEPPKERPQEQFQGKPGAPGGAPVFIPEYGPDFGEEDYIDHNYFDFGAELSNYEGQPENVKFFDYPDYGLHDYAEYPERQMNNLGDYEYPDYDPADYSDSELGKAEYDTKM